MDEIWKDIEGFEGYYQASSEGRIRSVDREVAGKAGSVRIIKGKLLKAKMNNRGYLMVHLWKENKHTGFLIHRLVYSVFCGSIPDDMQVNHIDEDINNNRLNNLNLMTCKENINFGSHNQRVAKANSKPVVALDADGKVVFEFQSTNEAGRCGFDQSHVSACCRGEVKTHRGYRWKYKEELENA